MLSSTNLLDVIVNNSAFMIMWTQVRDGGTAWASTSSLSWPVQEQVRDDHDKWSCWSSDHDYNHDAKHGYTADYDYDTDRNVWRTVFEIQDYKPSLIRESLTYQNQCFAGGQQRQFAHCVKIHLFWYVRASHQDNPDDNTYNQVHDHPRRLWPWGVWKSGSSCLSPRLSFSKGSTSFAILISGIRKASCWCLKNKKNKFIHRTQSMIKHCYPNKWLISGSEASWVPSNPVHRGNCHGFNTQLQQQVGL